MEQGRLSGADLTGQKHESLASLYTVDQGGETLAVGVSEIQERRVRRHLEGALHESVVGVIHGDLPSPAPRPAESASPPLLPRRWSGRIPGTPFTAQLPATAPASTTKVTATAATALRIRRRRIAARSDSRTIPGIEASTGKRSADLELARPVEGGVDGLEEHGHAGAQRDPQEQPDRDDHDAVGREGLGGRIGGLEDPELLALLAPLHVGGDTGLEAFVAELLVAREEVLVLALQRGELLGDPRRPRQIGVTLGDLGVQPVDVLARGGGAQLGALLLRPGILLGGGEALIPALGAGAFDASPSPPRSPAGWRRYRDASP